MPSSEPLSAAQGFKRLHVEGDALGQPAEAVLHRILFDQLPRLVGEIGDEADLVGIGVANRGIELRQPLEGADVIDELR